MIHDYPSADVPLFAPSTFWHASPELRAEVCNGCGTAGWKGWLVPDTVWGLTITPACQIHDWMYDEGTTIAHKDAADRAFLNNMLRLVNVRGGWLKRLRSWRCHTYYVSVSKFGGPAFWNGKNATDDMGALT